MSAPHSLALRPTNQAPTAKLARACQERVVTLPGVDCTTAYYAVYYGVRAHYAGGVVRPSTPPWPRHLRSQAVSGWRAVWVGEREWRSRHMVEWR